MLVGDTEEKTFVPCLSNGMSSEQIYKPGLLLLYQLSYPVWVTECLPNRSTSLDSYSYTNSFGLCLCIPLFSKYVVVKIDSKL